MKDKNYIIAIDGPAGAGKSTVAKLLAKELEILYIDSGAMYRAVTLYLKQKNLLNANESTIKSQLKNIKINFDTTKNVFLNGKNVSKKIRTSEISKNVSKISSYNSVRKDLVKRQQDFKKNGSLIMDGRDIGTKVFPNADLKIYLTCDVRERARRRKKDLEALGERVNLEELIQDVIKRDNLDSSREISPLTKPQDAIVIECTKLNIEEVITLILSFVKFVNT